MRQFYGRNSHFKADSPKITGEALPEIFFTSDAVLHLDGEWPDLECELEEVLLGAGSVKIEYVQQFLRDDSLTYS